MVRTPASRILPLRTLPFRNGGRVQQEGCLLLLVLWGGWGSECSWRSRHRGIGGIYGEHVKVILGIHSPTPPRK